MTRQFTAIEGGACRRLASSACAAPHPVADKAMVEPAVDIRLKPILASKGRASLWPARRAVVVRHRGASGLTISLTIPNQYFQGVSVDLALAGDGSVKQARVLLVHRDKDLEVELYCAAHDHDVIAEWRGWARELALPMLMRGENGDEVATRAFGALAVAPVKARRAPRAVQRRRSATSRRRSLGQSGDLPIYSEAREIIAYE